MLVEGEGFVAEMEVQSLENFLIPVEELRRLSSDNAIERRHPLLPVQQQLHDARRQRTAAPVHGCLRFGGPNQKTADRMTAIEGIDQTPNLVTGPHITALKLRQRHVPAVNVVQYRGNLHSFLQKTIRISAVGVFRKQYAIWSIA